MLNLDESKHPYAPCPKCGESAADRVAYTLWGGVIGPKMFTHVKCYSCGKKYNGKTGKDNLVNILLYTLVTGIIVFAFFFAVSFFLR
jgi:ribosomal protein L37AE/L43A